MLCDKCKQREANVHIKQSINGVTTERNLCSECAAKEPGLMNTFSGQGFFDDLFETSLLKRGSRRLGSIFDMGMFPETAPAQRDRRSLEFGNVGSPVLEEGLELPKITVKTGSQKEEKKEGKLTSDLKQKLAEAIQNENFEEAARLRDLIKNEKDGKAKE